MLFYFFDTRSVRVHCTVYSCTRTRTVVVKKLHEFITFEGTRVVNITQFPVV